MRKLAYALLCALPLAGCADSGVMDTGGGTYEIAVTAGTIVGGGSAVAYREANTFCAKQSGGSHAVLVGASDASQATFNGPAAVLSVTGAQNPNSADLHFRCGQ